MSPRHNPLYIKYLKLGFYKSTLRDSARHCAVIMVLIFLFTILLTPILKVDAVSETYSKERILVISSYSQEFPTIEGQLEGLFSALPKSEYHMDIEYMDSKRFYTEEHLQRFQESLEYKISQLEPYDLVIAGDDNALQFVMDNRDMFQDIPVVFYAINDVGRAQNAYDMGNITGVVETTSIKETLDLAVELYPSAQKLVMVVDQTPSGQGELKSIYEYESFYAFLDFEVLDLSQLSFEELRSELGKLDENSIYLHISAYYDKTGLTLSFYESLEFLTSNTSVPVFFLYDFGVGDGFFGGKVVDYYQQGFKAGEIAKRILNGESASSITPIDDTSVNRVIVDYQILKAYNLDESRLPTDTIFVNKPESVIEKYKDVLIIFFSVFLFLILIIIILVFNIRRRKHSEQLLKENNQELAAMYEEVMAMNEELESSELQLINSNRRLEEKNQQVQTSEARYRNLFELDHSGMWDKEVETDELYITKEWYMHFLPDEEESDREKDILRKFYSHIDSTQILQIKEFEERLAKGEISSYHLNLKFTDLEHKRTRYIKETGRGIYNASGALEHIIGAHRDITDSVNYEEKLKELAYKDQLTKMPNRVILKRFLRQHLDRNDVEINTGTVFQLDIDNFKFINNTYGHEIGDEILKEVADRLLRITDDKQKLGRISGDEFVIICPTIHSRTEVDHCAQKLLSVFEQQFHIRNRSIYITVSIGIAFFPENGRDFDLLLNRAGTAISIAKQNGKNRFEYYDESMNDNMENRIFIQNNIRHAIQNEHFELHYQPLYDVKNNRIKGFEALARWRDDLRGYISPLDFILVAEKMGLINQLGRWIMKEALSFAKRISNELGDDYYVSINVSTVQLIQQDFIDDLLDIVKEIGVSYHSFCIEITETALMQSFEKNAAKLDILRRLGVKISLDDFGTGYSSLSYLRRLPTDILKIDKSFIDEILNNNESKDLTEGIIVLAQKLGMEVIAEGIEKKEQLSQLRSYGCDGIQGYYIAKPMQEESAIEFIEDFEGRKEAFID